MAALDYCLKKLYQCADSDLQGYHAHVKAMESAFDWHEDHMRTVMDRAQRVVINQQPFYWKHVDVSHGMVLEDVAEGMPLLTHKPILVLEGSLNEPGTMCYLQAFYLTMILWTSERVSWFTSLYHSGMLRSCEYVETYATATSLCITWADEFLKQPDRTEEEWHMRFLAFSLCLAKCVPCPHTCGRVMIMGPEYFEQIDDVHVPNAMITPHLWSAPFSVFGFKYDQCKGHDCTQVTYSDKPIKAGEFIRVPLNNPFLVDDHASHMKQDKAAQLCRTVYSLGTNNLTPEDAMQKLQQLSAVLMEHVRIAEDKQPRWEKPPVHLWSSSLSSIAFASATTFCCVLQQCDYTDARIKLPLECMSRLIKHFNLPWNGWNTSILLDLQAPCYNNAIFDAWRAEFAAFKERAQRIAAVMYK